MPHAPAPDQFENSLVWAFLHTFLQYRLLHSAVDGPEGQWFVQITAGEQVHHLTDAEDAFEFVLDILEIIRQGQDGGR
ncbi:hypothetical protein A6A06_01315 [Streptomyces sp. CB02923]|uniref:hypothetical protein n=1 Tax=Streptomyces sp. CB02923 TaxID=1718985 RepID=UPI00093E1C26|nr:hypothetical protein [Streptomyces sp. CB02923]OKI09379.1 hypothetical protein A6A06_01315 [Streptomyces sp. CB02923]